MFPVLARPVLLLPLCLHAVTASGWEILATVKDDAGHVITNVSVAAALNYFQVYTSGVTDENGAVRLTVDDGVWSVGLYSDINARGYLIPPSRLVTVSGAGRRLELVCPKAVFSMRLGGRALDDRGEPLTNAIVRVSTSDYSFGSQTNTDETGRFELPFFGGLWELGLTLAQADSRELFLPHLSFRSIDGVDRTNLLLIARTPTTEVRVSVQDTLGSNVVSVIEASASEHGAEYGTSGFIDGSGIGVLTLFEGAWRLHVRHTPLSESGAALRIPDRTITVTGTQQLVSLTASDSSTHLRGQMVNNLGTPISDAFPQALTSDFDHRFIVASTRTSVDGGFDFKLLGGTWRLAMEDVSGGWLAPWAPVVRVIDGVDRTNVQVVVQRITARISGSVTDSSGSPLGGVAVEASTTIHDQLYRLYRYTDYRGSFQLPVFEGNWVVDVNDYALTQAGYHGVRPKTITVTNNDATVDFVVDQVIFTTRLGGRVVDSDGAPVSQVAVSAWNSNDSFTATTKTGSGGAFDLGVFGGAWSLSVKNFKAGDEVFLGPRISVAVEDAVDQSNLFLVVQKATAQITGVTTDTDGIDVTGLGVSASTGMEGTNYSSLPTSSTRSESSGFALDVFASTWEVQVSDDLLNMIGLQSRPSQTVLVAGTNAISNLIVQPILGDGRVPTLSPPTVSSNGAVQFLVTSQTARQYRIEASNDLHEWVPVSTNYTLSGSFIFAHRGTNTALSSFYRAVLLE